MKPNFKKTSLLSPKAYELADITLLCRHCYRSRIHQPVYLGKSLPRKTLLDRISFLNRDVDNIYYKFLALGPSLHTPLNVFGTPILRTTADRKELEDLFLDRHLTLDEIKWELEARLIQAVFRNASFYPYQLHCIESAINNGCDDFSQAMVAYGIRGKDELSHYRFHRRSLRFVSCGQPVIKQLAFDQLFSIFDVYIWIGIAAVVVFSSIFSSLVLAQEKSKNGIMRCCMDKSGQVPLDKWPCSLHDYIDLYLIPSLISYVKALVEQGDPIIVPLWNIPFLRWSFESFLLLVTVLSNAYKNENITKLTLPRAPIPYDSFDALIAHNFSIYSRGILIGGFEHASVKQSPEYSQFQSFILSFLNVNDIHSNGLVFKTEVSSFANAELAFWNINRPQEEFSNRSQRIIKHSKPIPNWYNIFLDTDGSCSLFGRDSRNCDVLKYCNHTAVLLPDVDASTKYYLMKNGNNSANVFLSKESLIEYQSGMTFGRWVSPLILQRLKSMEQSGMVEWLNDFIHNYLSRLRVGFDDNSYQNEEDEGDTGNDPTAASIYGNIFVVFVVILVGILISMMAFLWEIKNVQIKVFKKCTVKKFGPWFGN